LRCSFVKKVIADIARQRRGTARRSIDLVRFEGLRIKEGPDEAEAMPPQLLPQPAAEEKSDRQPVKEEKLL